MAVIAFSLMFLSDSRTALGLALISPVLATVPLIVRKATRISPAVILLPIPFCYIVVSNISDVNANCISCILQEDLTFTGRTVIWDFARREIDRSPFVGWGYQSFWLVGSDAPSVVDASGRVKQMPNAHNGYHDTMLELEFVGLASILACIIVTLHAVGRVADRDPARARLLLSVALFIVLYSFFESLWMRGFEFLWVLFVIIAVEIGRSRQPLPLRVAASGSRSRKRGCTDLLASAQTTRLSGRVS